MGGYSTNAKVRHGTVSISVSTWTREESHRTVDFKSREQTERWNRATTRVPFSTKITNRSKQGQIHFRCNKTPKDVDSRSL